MSTDHALLTHDAARRALQLEWLLFDVDGVMTDGRLVYGPEGEQWKVFDVRDGLGLKLAQRTGLKVGFLSGRENAALASRAHEVHVDALIMHRTDKDAAFTEFLVAHSLQPDKVAYVGDDLIDLPVIRRCGLSFAPSDAVADVRERVDRVLDHAGGRGAVREMVELVLRTRGTWDEAVAEFLDTGAKLG